MQQYVDDFIMPRRESDERALEDVRTWLTLVCRSQFNEEKTTDLREVIFLGVQMCISAFGISLGLSSARIHKLITYLEGFLSTNRCSSGAASSMAGRLMWSCAVVYGRLGRVFISPFYARSSATDPDYRLNGQLRR